MKKVKDATVEEILLDVTYHENMDSSLIIISNEDGSVFMTSYDGYYQYEVKTLKQCLIKKHSNYLNKYCKDDWKEFNKLDWSDYID